MDNSQTAFDYYEIDSVKAEKDNAMRRYRRHQNLRWLFKACFPLAPLSYALYRVNAPRQLLVAAFNSNLCVFLILNALVVVTCFLSGENNTAGEKVAESDIYGEYVANVESARRSGLIAGFKAVTPEAEEDKEVEISVSSETTSPEEASESEAIEIDKDVDVETVPFYEDKAVISEYEKTVVSSLSVVTINNNNNNNNNININKVKSYRRTQSESFEKESSVEPAGAKKGLVRSETDMHRNSDKAAESLSPVVEKLSDEEFHRRCEIFIKLMKYNQKLEP